MLTEKIKKYIDKFNTDDNEYYKQDIDNAHAFEWIKENAPHFECPDKTIEEIFYFRLWTLRKHIKTTKDGTMITEFLPPVPWGGTHNTIIAPTHHHIAEAKWLKGAQSILEDYTKLWLEEKSKTYLYSSPFVYALYMYSVHNNNYDFVCQSLDLMLNYYSKMEEEHRTNTGLFWSEDNHDAMEYSISGTSEELVCQKGIRPTLNSYMAANAYAIACIAKKAGRQDIFEEYTKKYEEIKFKITELLWDGEFYKSLHGDDVDNLPTIDELSPMRNAKEVIGYIPWAYKLAPEGFDKAFEELKKEDGFKCEYGIMTAEKRHPRFLYECEHECLWNGYVWPFATSQVIDAVISLLGNYEQNTLDNNDLYELISTYAKSHYMKNEDGKRVCWIDEVRHPLKDDWSSRTILKDWGWLPDKGGLERGKDYNHSTFCNLVIEGLLGIRSVDGKVSVSPRVFDKWDYFKIENLWIAGNEYEIIYDKDGSHYNGEKGLVVTQK